MCVCPCVTSDRFEAQVHVQGRRRPAGVGGWIQLFVCLFVKVKIYAPPVAVRGPCINVNQRNGGAGFCFVCFRWCKANLNIDGNF